LLFLPPRTRSESRFIQLGVIIPLFEYLILNHLQLTTVWHLKVTGNITRIVVPFPPGGTVDPIARMVQPGLQQRLGATIVIENKPGASGSIGAAQVAKSPPDGSNWMFVFDTHAVNLFLAEPLV
jgi:tripartite-type tricarboxylate transporter receptor subunit TctC